MMDLEDDQKKNLKNLLNYKRKDIVPAQLNIEKQNVC